MHAQRVVGSVCLCVCPLLNISPLERLFVSQSVPHTQRAAKVRNVVWFSLKMLRCRARALPRGGCARVIDCITCAIDLYARPRNPVNPLIQHFVKSAHWLCRGYESSPEYTLRHTHYRGIVKPCRALTPVKAV